MTTCSWSSQLSAYHDGELPADQQAAVQQHLIECAACAAELADLREVSALFIAAPVPHLSQIRVHRLHNRLQRAADQGIVRLAGVLSGVAAAIVMVGSVWLMRVHETPQSAPPWINIPMNSDEVAMNESATPVAQYYLTDASQVSEDAP